MGMEKWNCLALILTPMTELNMYQRNRSTTNKTRQTKKKPSSHLGSDTNKQPSSSKVVIQ